MLGSFFLGLLVGHVVANPLPGAPIHRLARSAHVEGRLRYVEDSGICETTPGVKQYSGYVDVAANQSMWFWMFEARHSPETAPFALWLNGGPGCPSTIGLFDEHGPCKVNADATATTLNPYSWNEYANMIYVDQPIGTGFSYGTEDVDTTPAAAPAVWTLFQILFSSPAFKRYQAREFGLFTESFGGRYGPVFSEAGIPRRLGSILSADASRQYFLSQNAKIASKSITGVPVHLKTIGIASPWLDPPIQNLAYVDFAQRRYNSYFDLVNATALAQLKRDAKTCSHAYATANQSVIESICNTEIPNLAVGDHDPYDILQGATPPNPNDTFPSPVFGYYLQRPDVQKAIGAEVFFTGCSDSVLTRFYESGDYEGSSSLPDLGRLVDTGMRTLIWAGTRDWICNWLGAIRATDAMPWKHRAAFEAAPWTPLRIGAKVYGETKTVANLAFVKVFDAGHEIPAYQGLLALELFKQTMMLEPPHSVP